jgi:hypothetical protein
MIISSILALLLVALRVQAKQDKIHAQQQWGLRLVF